MNMREGLKLGTDYRTMRKVFIIAEAGVNHNGNLETAKKLVDVAVLAGADAVKFQTFKAEKLVCRNAKKAEYQLETTDKEETQFSMLKRLELNAEMHQELSKYCREKKIMFISTPFDIESAKMLVDLGVSIIKIPSGEITNYPYLREIAKYQKKVILSTGMSSLEEVQSALEVLKGNGTDDIVLLHCNTQYPTPLSDVNLLAMAEMRKKLGLPVGYSDHTLGIEAPLAAVALGACVIEKHFTLDKNMEGPDHKASLEPYELKNMVEGIRKVEQMLGNGIKQASRSEKDNLLVVRKSIVAARAIQKGEMFTEENLTVKRPGIGVNPMRWNEVIGMVSKQNYKEDEMIRI